jgi:photosystem II stability/assembly factor-like uncharacterized protein
MTLVRHRSLLRLTLSSLAMLGLFLSARASTAQGFQAVFTRDGIDVWAVGDQGAVWRSFDSGTSWTGEPSLGARTLRGVAARGLTALAVGDSGRVFRSTNSGGTWTLATLLGAPDLRAIEWPADNAAWIVGGNGGIWFSNDGGQVWTPQTSGTAQKLNAVRFRDASNGWAVGAGGVALRTINGGGTWTPSVTPTTQDLFSVDFIGSTVWAVGAYGTALRSFNSGGLWNPINLNLDSQGDARAVWLETSNNVTITGGGGFLRKSQDGGSTWSWAIHPLLAPGSDYFAFGGTKAWLVSSTSKAVTRTLNGGTTWTFPNGVTTDYNWGLKLTSPFVITRGNTFATTPQNRDLLWCVIGPYIYKSRNRGETWALLDSIPNTLKTNSFYVSPKDTTHWVAAVGTPDRIMRTLNSGGAWETTLTRDFSEYGMPLEMHPDKPDTFFFAPENGRFYRSRDFCATWDTLSIPGFRSPCDIVVVPGDDSKIVVGDGVTGQGLGQIFQSTNGGASFTARYTGVSSEVPTVWGNRLENNVLFAANWSSGGVWRSADYGQSWQMVSEVSSAWGGATANDDPKAVMFNRYAGIPNYLSVDQGASFSTSSPMNSGSGYAVCGLDRSTWLDLHSFGIYKLAITQTPVSALIQTLTLAAPNGGESWNAGSVHAVTWSASTIGLVRIEYRKNPADPWHLVADVEGYLGTYDWTLPNTPTNTAEVRVSDAWDGSPVDASNGVFAIVAPQIAVTPLALAWGTHPVSTATLDTVRVSNPGNATLHVTSITTGSPIFTLGRTSLVLAPGASDTLGVTFRPASAVDYLGTLSLVSDGGPQVDVPLSGTGDATNSIVLVSPDAGNAWQYGTSHNVTWQSQGVSSVAVEYRTGEAQPWLTIADPVVAANGSVAWIIPNAPTSQARVRVREISGVLSATSELFSLTVPSFVLASPYDFGAVPPLYATWDTVHIANPGTAPVTVSNVTSDNPHFVPGRTSFAIPAADSDTLSLTFRPTTTGPDSALITFTDDTPAGTHTLRARGQGFNQTGIGSLPLAFALEPNQPNPFGQQTSIRYALPEAARVRLEVFDLAGRRVTTLVDGERPAGLHAVVFRPADQRGLASGVYFVRMAAGAFEQTRKMLYFAR